MSRKDFAILGILVGLAAGITIGGLCSWSEPAPAWVVIVTTTLTIFLAVVLKFVLAQEGE